MENEILIYAIREGEARPFMEDLISTQCKTRADIEKVVTAARAAGWHSFRLSTWSGEKPNFENTVKDL